MQGKYGTKNRLGQSSKAGVVLSVNEQSLSPGEERISGVFDGREGEMP